MADTEVICPVCGSHMVYGQLYCSTCGSQLPYPNQFDEYGNPANLDDTYQYEYQQPQSDSVRNAFANAENQKAKKPKKKIPFKAVVLLAVLLFVAAGLKLITAKKASNTKGVDLSTVYTVTMSGADTCGTIDVEIDDDTLLSLLSAKADIEDTTSTKYMQLTALVDSMKATLDQNTNLSNGDEVTVTITYNEDLADIIGVDLKNAESTITIADLPEIVRIDPFESIDVTFEGASPYMSITSIENTEYTSLGLTYTVDTINDLRAGEIVTLICDSDADTLLDTGFVLTRTEMPYTVPLLGTYVEKASQLTDDAIADVQKQALQVAEDTNDETYATTRSGFVTDKYNVVFNKPQYVGMIVGSGDDGIAYSSLYVVYKCDGKITGQAGENSSSPERTYFESYRVIEIDDPILSASGKLEDNRFFSASGSMQITNADESRTWTLEAFEDMDQVIQSAYETDGYSNLSAIGDIQLN